ncbi:hypothetical protein [Escherichia coli]|uniref:hypothetical protein n=1 Tax=Escherichia coli TaxID=562 RepID=UPI00287432DD|nr:hypothetical protein [Escherichia coli]MDS0725360.1 hypothetical protein [Escherichia coli]MDS0811034.1 hypothetical protein [Escherichia coli]MDT3852977.1 hypothetical protein [Escherichia coli]MDT3861337.1 hypothetical protein [Escherichia coli]
MGSDHPTLDLINKAEREVFMTHGYVDSHIIDQALRLRLKDETSVILSDLYLQILQYIEMHKTTLTDIIINDRESVLS